MSRKSLALVFLLSLMIAACGSAPPKDQVSQNAEEAVGSTIQVEGGEYTNVSVSELKTMLDNKDFVFVNVHIPFEGDIPTTDLSIPYDQIEQHLDELPADQGAKIVLYCRSGRMSAIAAEALVKLGYTNIWNLEGGFQDWEKAGLPIEK